MNTRAMHELHVEINSAGKPPDVHHGEEEFFFISFQYPVIIVEECNSFF
jgi:hypothetical protein